MSDLHTFELFAEIGVILLMFSVGIEFSLRELREVKWVAILGGPLGILLSVGLGMAVGRALGWSALEGMVVGMVVSVASTMVLARLLIDHGELHSRHGRIMIGITLVEDLAVVVLIMLIPRLGVLEPGRLLDVAAGLGLAVAILAPFLFLAARVVPAILLRVARLQSPEIFLLVALALALATAAVTQAAGLSLALGAFLAGLLISDSDYGHETLARLLSLRDVFVALFFVTVGALIDPAVVAGNVRLLGIIVGLVIVGKLLIWAAVVRLFGHPTWVAVLVAVGLTQIGEFSFILVQVARSAGHIGADIYNATLAAALLTILSNALMVRYAPRWVGRAWLRGPPEPVMGPDEAQPREDPVVVCGFGRVGSAVADAFEAFGTPYVAIESNPDIVRGLRERGVPCVYGDASQRSLLELAGAERARLVVVALPDFERAELAVRHARSLNRAGPILARAHDVRVRDRLLAAGATEVIQPEFEAASTLIRHALRELGLSRDRVLAYLERWRDALEALPARGARGEALPEVRDLSVGRGGVADRSLGEAAVRERYGVTVLSIGRADGERVPHPSAGTVLRPGDRLRVFGLAEHIEAFTRALGEGKA
ncbi:MAG: cation:proton antiporter [Candidatus Rokubacteria bacterium]|nr:cation:proton antiporter [Candidatus Rokubacteria bacterium]MBI3104683.1 cation:proton antiporter [Candidatus Rokubacteria bacterium]